MMRNKIVISNDKLGDAGKSTSIRYAFEILKERYNGTVLIPEDGIYDPAQDVKAIIEIPQADGHIVKVGIESEGDPRSRQPWSIDDFIAQRCEILLVASRWTLKSEEKVYEICKNQNWQIIWFDNSTMWVDDKHNTSLKQQDEQLQDQLSRDYGFYVASLIERLVLMGGVI
jgi:hypothetical protein